MIKKLVLACIALMILIISGFTAIVLFLPTEIIKTQVLEAVESKLGQKMTIDGPIAWQLFPSLRLHVSQLSLYNPPSFNQKTFATVKEADIVLALGPLFRKQIDIKTFILHEPQIMLEKNEKGLINWEGFLQAPPATSTTANSTPLDVSDSKLFSSLGHIQIKEGQILYNNLQTKKQMVIAPIALTLKPKAGGMALDASLKAMVQKTPYHLAIKALIAGSEKSYTFQGLEVTGTAQAIQWSIDSSEGSLDLAKGSISIPAFKIRLNEDAISGHASIRLWPLHLNVATQGKTLNLDHLSAQASSSGTPASRKVEKSPSFKTVQPSLKEGSIDVSMHWDEIIKNGLHFDKVVVTAGALDGALMIKTNAEYQSGLFKSEHMVSFASESPVIRHRGQFKNIPVHTFLSQAVNIRSLHGQGFLSFDITTRGLDDFTGSAIGKMSLELTKGSFTGADIGYYFAQARSLLKKQSLEDREKKNETFLFDTANTHIQISQGILHHQSIEILSKDYSVDGEGHLRMASGEIHYALRAIDKHKPDGPPLAIRLSGTLSHPIISPDFNSYVTYFVEREIKKRLLNNLAPGSDSSSDPSTGSPPKISPEKLLEKLFKL